MEVPKKSIFKSNTALEEKVNDEYAKVITKGVMTEYGTRIYNAGKSASKFKKIMIMPHEHYGVKWTPTHFLNFE